jgi:hypothetical protein
MSTTRRNGKPTFDRVHDSIDAQFDAVLNQVRRFVTAPQPPAAETPPSRLRHLAARGSAAIRAYPVAAVGVALALGYLITRLARR